MNILSVDYSNVILLKKFYVIIIFITYYSRGCHYKYVIITYYNRGCKIEAFFKNNVPSTIRLVDCLQIL